MNRGPIGKWGYHAGASGTVTLTGGEVVASIHAHSTAGGSFTVNGGDSIPIPASASWFKLTMPTDALADAVIVFTTTDSYVVQTIKPGAS